MAPRFAVAVSRRLLTELHPQIATERGGDPVCPLCGRPIPPDAKQSLHHLVPKLKGGKHGPTVLMHQICHNEIHASLTEAELARHFATPSALRAHPRLARFVAWVAKKDPYFHSRTVGRRRKRGRSGSPLLGSA